MSLWEIVRVFRLSSLLFALDNLRLLEGKCEKLRRSENGGYPVPQRDLEYTRAMFPITKRFLEEAGFADSLHVLDAFLNGLGTEEDEEEIIQRGPPFGPTRVDVAQFETELRHIRASIERELKHHVYFQVVPDKVAFLQDDLFGAEVSTLIPDATSDITGAGMCIAAGNLDTAAVFHLMRSAEHGLRKLARVLRVKLTHSGHTQAIETADWDKVITGIKNKIASTRSTLPKGSKRDAQLEKYSDLADHCLFMKDIWRNHVSHTKRPYSPTEALNVFERVRDFMAALARDLGGKRNTQNEADQDEATSRNDRGTGGVLSFPGRRKSSA